MPGQIVEVLDAGQRVLVDRIELLALATPASGAGALTSFALLMCALASSQASGGSAGTSARANGGWSVKP